MNWLSDLAIKRPVMTTIMLIIMVGMGLISLFGIPRELIPMALMSLLYIEMPDRTSC